MNVSFLNMMELFEEEGEYNLLPLQDEKIYEISSVFGKFGEKTVASSTEDYLHRESKILSIIRDINKKKCLISQKDIFSQIFRWSAVEANHDKGKEALADYVISRVTQEVRSLIIKGITLNENEVSFTMPEELKDMLGSNHLSRYISEMEIRRGRSISYYSTTTADSGNQHLREVYFSVSKGVAEFPEEWSVLEMKPSQTASCRYFRGYRNLAKYINDFAVLCARAIILQKIISSRGNKVLEGYITTKVTEEIMFWYAKNGAVMIAVGDTEAERICKELKMAYKIVPTDKNGYYDGRAYALRFQKLSSNIKIMLEMLEIIPVQVENYCKYRVQKKKYRYVVPCCDAELSEVLYVLLRQEHLDDEERRYENEVKSSYAKSYQTKKNIPEKIINEMAASQFNDYFGYVEFDESTDVEKIRELAKEWEAINTILRQDKKELVSLRFRRLGNHSASGLYYPAQQCICVDVRCPSSFVHEYFHMLDYTNGKLSSSYEFSCVYDLYAEQVKELTKDKKLKGKYDLNYYLTRTEVFARCGEMYLTRCIGVDNSLCRPDETTGFAYPQDKKFMASLREYFDNFMKIYCEQEQENIYENLC